MPRKCSRLSKSSRPTQLAAEFGSLSDLLLEDPHPPVAHRRVEPSTAGAVNPFHSHKGAWCNFCKR